MELINKLILLMDKTLRRSSGYSKKLISFIKDRKGHDFRYSIDFSKLKNELGWSPKTSFEKGLKITVDSYLKGLN